MRAEIQITKTKLIENALEGFLHFKPAVIGADRDLQLRPGVIARLYRDAFQMDMPFASQVCGERCDQRSFTNAYRRPNGRVANVLLSDKRPVCPVDHRRKMISNTGPR